MASNYTCTACSRAFTRSLQHANKTSLRRAQRAFSTTPASRYSEARDPALGVQPQAMKKPQSGINSGVAGLAQKLREKAPLMTETYVAYGATQELIKECSRPGEYKIPQALQKDGVIPVDENGTHVGEATGWWYDTLGLTPTFSNWSQITFLHMYMLQVRFRMFPATHAPVWIQHLTNQAFYAAEDRLVVWHKYNANSLRQKQLKDMFSQWRAILLSYDEGLMKGDAWLAAAIWRNLLAAKEDVDFEKLAQIVGYMRRELKRLDRATDGEVSDGSWKFHGDPSDEASAVKALSKLMITNAKE